MQWNCEQSTEKERDAGRIGWFEMGVPNIHVGFSLGNWSKPKIRYSGQVSTKLHRGWLMKEGLSTEYKY